MRVSTFCKKYRISTQAVYKKIKNHEKELMVLCEQVQVIDKSRLGKLLCRISNKTLAEVDKALAVSVGINNNFGGNENE